MQSQHRLRKNSQFQAVYHKGKSVGARDIALMYLPSSSLRVGFSVSRKVGIAVQRNLIKRRLRAAFRAEIPLIRQGLYIIVARPSAAGADYQSLRRSLRYLLKKQQLYVSP